MAGYPGRGMKSSPSEVPEGSQSTNDLKDGVPGVVLFHFIVSSFGKDFPSWPAWFCVFVYFWICLKPLSHQPEDYFEKHYREGGHFDHPDYEDYDRVRWTWRHKPTRIQVWKDAIDLTSGHGGRVYFHYTAQLAFENRWGQGIFTVPKPLDQWKDRFQLLDNNFRNMMKRDEEEHGRDYVEKGYPPRAAFCVPILIEETNAYHVATRATPEIIEAGTKPGTNLADKLLNETGMPPRTCVVLRISGEEGVENARGRLLDALRARQAHPSAKHVDTIRLAEVLRKRGLYEEAFPLLTEVLQLLETELGVEHEDSLKAAADLGILYQSMGNYAKAEELYRRVLLSSEKILGSEHAGTLTSLNNVAGLLSSLVQSILMTSASLTVPVFFPHLHISTHKSLQHIPDLKSQRRECWRICFGAVGTRRISLQVVKRQETVVVLALQHRMLALCDKLWQMVCNNTHPALK